MNMENGRKKSRIRILWVITMKIVTVLRMGIVQLITKEEAENLIKEMSEIDTIGVTNEKQREAMYKNALLHNQCREWVSLIKTSYGRNKERIQAGKKTINIDERYMSSAEKFLYGELAVVMEMPRDKVSGYVKEHLDTAMV